jgi:hypothetical protein
MTLPSMETAVQEVMRESGTLYRNLPELVMDAE